MFTSKLKFDQHNKELLLERDYQYFLERDLKEGNYKQEDIDKIHASYRYHSDDIKKQLKENKKQCLYYLYGQVILMFDGGHLPAKFKIDGFTRELDILNFESVGENWAYFDAWQKHERKKLNRKKAWEYITKIGAVLAILLTLLKLWDGMS